MKKMLFVCDKCGKIIPKNPVGIVLEVLQEDGCTPEESQPLKYAELSKRQFCPECTDKIVECLMENVEDYDISALDVLEAKEMESSVAETPEHDNDKKFPTLDDLMAKYAGNMCDSNVPNGSEEQPVIAPGRDGNRKEELISKLSECVLEMEFDEVVEVARAYIAEGFPALDGIMDGLVDGMNKASALFNAEEYFITDVLLCSDAMYAGLNILRPHLPAAGTNEKVHKIVIGVVEGDTHDIGKNLVKIMLETAGFEVYDLGRDVPADSFVNKAIEVGASIICMSTLMTTTMDGMRVVIDKLVKKGVRDRFKIMVGGSPLSKKFADEIGADGYTSNAVDAVKLAKQFVGMEESTVVLGA